MPHIGFRPLSRIFLALSLFVLGRPMASTLPVEGAQPKEPAAIQPQVVSNTPITHFFNEPYSRWTIGGGFLYWGNCETLIARPPDGPTGIQPQTTRGYLRRIPTHGGTPKTLSTDAFCEDSVAADDSGLYSWDPNAKVLKKRPIEAQETPVTIYNPRDYFIPFNYPPVSNLVLDADYVYWASPTKIVRMKKDGSGITLIANATAGATLAIDKDDIYWLDNRGLWYVNKTCVAQPCGEQKLTAAAAGTSLLRHTFSSRIGIFGFSSTLFWNNNDKVQAWTCSTFRFPSSCSVETLYTAPAGSVVGQIGTDGTSLFWLERRRNCPSGQFCSFVTRLQRRAYTGTSADTIADEIADTPGLHIETDDLGVYFEDPQLGRLPFNAAPIVRDMRPDAWEVTQGIQSLTNDVPLVATKPTYVRVYGKQFLGPQANTVEAVLNGRRGGSPLPGSPLQPLNGSRSLTTGGSYNRANLGDSWLFQLPASWIDGAAIELNVVVDPRGLYNKTAGTNQRTGTFSFVRKAPVCAVFIPVRTNAPPASTRDTNFWTMIDRFKTLWSVPDVFVYHQDDDIAKLVIKWGGPFDLIPYPGYGPYSIPDNNNRIIISMIERDILSSDPSRCNNARARTHYVGMVHPDTNTGTNTGFANFAFAASWVKLPPHDTPPPVGWTSPGAGSTMAQEMSHNYNGVFGNRWKHVNCGNPDGINPSYPYNPCTLDDRPLNNPVTHWGFDVLTQTPIAPNAAGDYMSYSSSPWVSDYSWRGMLNETRNATPPPASPADVGAVEPSASIAAAEASPFAAELAAATSVVVATGVLTPSLTRGQLNPLLVLPDAKVSPAMLQKWQLSAAAPYNASTAPADATHTFHLQLVGTDGTILEDRAITPGLNDDDEGPNQTATFKVTFPAPTATVARINLLDGTTVLNAINPGIATPTVTLLQPTGGETVDDQLTVSWRAKDADPQDRLFATLQYSPDLGQTWRALITNLPDPGVSDTTTITFNKLSGIPGSTPNGALLRVAVTDGYHTALATSAPFTVKKRPPEPHIASPSADQPIVAGQSLQLHGGASDAEDGGLSGDALRWTVDGTSVGTGGDRVVAGLAPGNHTVSLTARNAAGLEATVTTTANIAALRIPVTVAPTLSGACDDPAYASAVTLSLAPYVGGSQATAHLLRTATDLWVCFSGLARTTGGPGDSVGLRVDVNNTRDATIQPSDAAFFVGEDGTPNVGSDKLQSRTSAAGTIWNAELRIPAGAIGGFNHVVGIDLAQQWVRFTGDDYHWPHGSIYNKPNTWARTVLGDPPEIASLSRNDATVGEAPPSVTITGANFLDGAKVQWNGAPRTTTFVDATHLKFQIDAADLATAGLAAVRVVNPNLPAEPSNTVRFTVYNARPVLTALSPDSAQPGRGDMTLTVNGSGFADGAVITWNGIPLSTHFVNSTQLTATIDASRFIVAGQVPVAVTNPSPSRGASTTLTFTIADAPPTPTPTNMPTATVNPTATGVPIGTPTDVPPPTPTERPASTPTDVPSPTPTSASNITRFSVNLPLVQKQ
ncbi:MAG: Ig-like domain-containing protein [Herpetosiphon sp.]